MPDAQHRYFETDPSLAGLSLYEAEQEGHDGDTFGHCCNGSHGPLMCHTCGCEHPAPRDVQACVVEPGYGGIGGGDDVC